MDGALTGRDAAEALSLASQLGNRNARFDGRSVMQSLRSRAGRLRVAASLTLAVHVERFHVETSPRRSGARRRPGRPQRPAAASAAPERPPGTPERENGARGLP